MFLSRMPLNPARRGTKHLLGSRQRLHAAIMSCAPPQEDERLLWRLDETSKALTLYLVSPRQPDLTHIVEQAGWPTTETWESRDYAPFLSRLAVGQRWHFRVTVNPVRAVRQESGRSKLQAARTIDHIENWLTKREDSLGIEVCRNGLAHPGDSDAEGLDLIVSDIRSHRFSRTAQGGRGGSPVTIATATMEGNLTVTNAGALREALGRGIGRGRAYGCGLMTLAPT